MMIYIRQRVTCRFPNLFYLPWKILFKILYFSRKVMPYQGQPLDDPPPRSYGRKWHVF